KGVARIARREMDTALEQLSEAPDGPGDEAVHEARKCFKKIRAVLRLVRPEIGEVVYERENTWFRDAGRPLTEVRDAKILVESLDKLVTHCDDHVRERSFGGVRAELLAHHR